MNGVIIASACLLATIATLAAQKPTDGERTWDAPTSADSRQNPLDKQPDILAGGKKIFHQRCGFCHGYEGTGSNRGPNLMTRRVQDQSDGALFWKISSGNTRTGMPGFSFLPEAQRWQLVSHLRAEAQQ
jgi:mono/diheme cytochrome c family protein